MSDNQFQKYLENYAKVVLKVGLNVQPGQRVWIRAWVENADFVRVLTEQAYKLGASFVDVLWDDEQARLTRFQHAPRDSFSLYSNFRKEAIIEAGERRDAMISMQTPDPSLLMGQDPELVSAFQKAQVEIGRPWIKFVRNRLINWVGIRPPTKGWAAKVFPELPPEERIERLWDVIFEMSRIKTDDPLKAWEEHIADLAGRTAFFNQSQFAELRLKAPGTDLTIGLPDGHLWRSARMEAQDGTPSVVNIPTEETFTMPHRERVNGTVRSTKPLNVRGYMFIENFNLTFKDGKIVDARAEVGEELLLKLLDENENARYIGEIALVPNSSPISQFGRPLYSSLFDENASCHLAFGAALNFNMQGGESMNAEEFEARGGNNCAIHEDFMIGSGEMDIDAVTKDGETVAVMRSGEWAFEV